MNFSASLRPGSRVLARFGVVFLATLASTACGGDSSSPSTPLPAPPPGDAQFALQGDAESPQGATWTYRGTFAGVAVDLQGILLKPRGGGIFPAVILSHGAGGNANNYARGVATEMVQWGLVCIATNYTHAGGVPLGAPGTASQPGASDANVLRGRVTYDVLRRLGYVDMSRIAAHGHSMGAFLTAALVAARPQDFRAASHTAGGVRTGGSTEAAAPTETQVRAIRSPYQMHHGDADRVVPLAMDQRLVAILQGLGVTAELHVYSGADHDDVSRDGEVMARIRAWYVAHRVL